MDVLENWYHTIGHFRAQLYILHSFILYFSIPSLSVAVKLDNTYTLHIFHSMWLNEMVTLIKKKMSSTTADVQEMFVNCFSEK